MMHSGEEQGKVMDQQVMRGGLPYHTLKSKYHALQEKYLCGQPVVPVRSHPPISPNRTHYTQPFLPALGGAHLRSRQSTHLAVRPGLPAERRPAASEVMFKASCSYRDHGRTVLENALNTDPAVEILPDFESSLLSFENQRTLAPSCAGDTKGIPPSYTATKNSRQAYSKTQRRPLLTPATPGVLQCTGDKMKRIPFTGQKIIYLHDQLPSVLSAGPQDRFAKISKTGEDLWCEKSCDSLQTSKCVDFGQAEWQPLSADVLREMDHSTVEVKRSATGFGTSRMWNVP